jgi:hypothetical protein
MVTLDIEVEKEVFLSGDTVTGQIVLQVPSPTAFKDVLIELIGEEKVGWQEEKWGSPPIQHQDHQTFLSEMQELTSNQTLDGT